MASARRFTHGAYASRLSASAAMRDDRAHEEKHSHGSCFVGGIVSVLGVLLQSFTIAAYVRVPGADALDAHGGGSLVVHIGQLAIVIGALVAYWGNWPMRRAARSAFLVAVDRASSAFIDARRTSRRLGQRAPRLARAGHPDRGLLVRAASAWRELGLDGSRPTALPVVPDGLDDEAERQRDTEREERRPRGVVLERLAAEVAEQRRVRRPQEPGDDVVHDEAAPRERVARSRRRT